MKDQSVRIGFKAVGLFPNAGIFVIRNLDSGDVAKLLESVARLRATLSLIGKGDIAGKLVCEVR
jgi:hypothetical protein